MSEPLEPLYTSAEMRAAEEGHDGEELMQRAGRALAGARAILPRAPLNSHHSVGHDWRIG